MDKIFKQHELSASAEAPAPIASQPLHMVEDHTLPLLHNAPAAQFHGDLVSSSRLLYTPSAFAKESLLHLQEIGRLEARQPHTSRRSLESYLFFIVLRGSGLLEYRGERRELTEGDCVFVDCRAGYAHTTSQNLWALQWVHFTGSAMPGIYSKYAQRGGGPAFTPPSPERFERLWARLYTLAESADHIRDMRINEALTSLLTLLMEQSWHPETAAGPAVKRQSLLNVKEYLDQHFAEKISLDDLAVRFYMNKFYLSHKFKEQFGLTVMEHLLGLRVTRAKHLLRFTDMAVDAISSACGVEDANYFSRMFRKVEGMTPMEYRRRW